MEARPHIWPSIDHENANRFADLHLNRLIDVLGGMAIEYHVIHIPGADHSVHVWHFHTICTIGQGEIALYQDQFLRRRPALLRIDDECPIHAGTGVHQRFQRATVVQVGAGPLGPEVPCELFARVDRDEIDIRWGARGVDID